jgi:hypothetical protein
MFHQLLALAHRFQMLLELPRPQASVHVPSA